MSKKKKDTMRGKYAPLSVWGITRLEALLRELSPGGSYYVIGFQTLAGHYAQLRKERSNDSDAWNGYIEKDGENLLQFGNTRTSERVMLYLIEKMELLEPDSRLAVSIMTTDSKVVDPEKEGPLR